MFLCFCQASEEELIHCPICHKEVGCDADMLLVPPKYQVPRHDLYINDGVLLLDFLKCGNWSKEESTKICERCVNFFAKTYGETWAYVSPYKRSDKDKEAIMTTKNTFALPTQQP